MTAAAGGVLWRPAGPAVVVVGVSVEVALVHRPRYDDWSLPKGKLLPGEPALLGGCREVMEETGFVPVVGRRLPSVSYPWRDGVKTVDYWAMRAGPGRFVPSREVDALAWLPVPAAAGRASYQHDVDLLAGFGTVQPDTMVLLVRHAEAGERRAWTGDDRLRPLDDRGRAQAEVLRRVLRWFGPRAVWSANPVRCVQTVAPLAAGLGLPVRLAPAVSEVGYRASPEAALRFVRELARAGEPVVVCSQGGAIPGLLVGLAAGSDVDLPAQRPKKGSVWALSFTAGTLVAADYYPGF